MPKDAQVTFLGDGEFDGISLQADLRTTDWQYVCRSASNILVRAYGLQFHVADLNPARGQLLAVTPAWMTAEEYGPLSILAIWEQHYQEPIYLVSNLADLDEAVQLYKKRPQIETFFSDQKSRGFNIHKSHLSEREATVSVAARLVPGLCVDRLSGRVCDAG
jgi:Transposase DDE domain